MTLPTSADSDTYGGAKQDFTTIVDPQTVRSAAEINALVVDAAAMTRTSTRAYLQFTGSSSNPVPNFHNSHWGSTVAVIPVIVRSGTGVFAITFPATVTDPLGDVQSLNLSAGWGNVEGDTLGHVQVTKTGPNTFGVNLWDSSGTPSDLIGFLIDVFVN